VLNTHIFDRAATGPAIIFIIITITTCASAFGALGELSLIPIDLITKINIVY
jgi:hypothetical protein